MVMYVKKDGTWVDAIAPLVDSTPTSGSTRPVSSNGVYEALRCKSITLSTAYGIASEADTGFTWLWNQLISASPNMTASGNNELFTISNDNTLNIVSAGTYRITFHPVWGAWTAPYDVGAAIFVNGNVAATAQKHEERVVSDHLVEMTRYLFAGDKVTATTYSNAKLTLYNWYSNGDGHSYWVTTPYLEVTYLR